MHVPTHVHPHIQSAYTCNCRCAYTCTYTFAYRFEHIHRHPYSPMFYTPEAAFSTLVLGRRSMWQLVRGKVVPKASRRWGGFFHNDAEHRDFTAIGTAAGVLPSCSHCFCCCCCCWAAAVCRASLLVPLSVQLVCCYGSSLCCLLD